MKRLHEVLDNKNYKKLVAEFGGKRMWIPKAGNIGFRDKNYIYQRNSAIIYSYKEGKTIKSLARTYGLSEKRIYDILNGRKSRRKRPSTARYFKYLQAV